MERLWGLHSHWQPHGHCYQPHPAVFYVRLATHHGLPHHYLHGAGLLEKYEKVYMGGQEESLVLFVKAHPTLSKFKSHPVRLPKGKELGIYLSKVNWLLPIVQVFRTSGLSDFRTSLNQLFQL